MVPSIFVPRIPDDLEAANVVTAGLVQHLDEESAFIKHLNTKLVGGFGLFVRSP